MDLVLVFHLLDGDLLRIDSEEEFLRARAVLQEDQRDKLQKIEIKRPQNAT